MSTRRWYWINTTYACGGLATDARGFIVIACPIYRRWQGQPLERLLAYLKQRQRLIELVALDL